MERRLATAWLPEGAITPTVNHSQRSMASCNAWAKAVASPSLREGAVRKPLSEIRLVGAGAFMAYGLSTPTLQEPGRGSSPININAGLPLCAWN